MLMPPQRSRVTGAQSVKVLETLNASSLRFLVLGDASRVSGANCREEEASLNSPKKITHFTNTIGHTFLFFICMIDEHVPMNLVSLNKNSKPH